MSTPEQHRLIGQVIADRYRVVELLGEGGMGAVYLAEHLTLHKQVALKVVHPDHCGNAELAARFEREAMATSRIDHPNVISAIDFGTLEDGTAFLAVQLVRGPSLTKVLETVGRLHWARAAEIGAQIADALCAAHGHGIVHRDLKPDNVLLQQLDDDGELVKVLDFGVAKFTRESLAPPELQSDSKVTQIGLVIGTPGYMAPEQAIGSPAGYGVDLYALGVILWESITGQTLWSATDLQVLVEKQLSETPRRLREVIEDPTLPALLEDLVANLLLRRCDERPADASLVREQLRAIVALNAHADPRWRTGARRVARTALAEKQLAVSSIAQTVTEAVAPQPPKPSLRPSRRPGRTTRTAWLLTLLVTTILGGAVFLIATGQLELRAQGEAAEVAQQVAKQLDLPPPLPVAPTATPAQARPAIDRKTGLPATLAPAFERLIAADARDDRVSAANAMLSHLPLEEIPLYVRRMAHLQLGAMCVDKRREIEALAELGDPRALPLLINIAQKPRRGCGRKKREDCLACLRAPLNALIRELEREQHESMTTPRP